MAAKSRKEEQTEATRNALLRVARRYFAERGYSEAGIETVVQRARVTRGALYHHFRDKLDLFRAVFEREEQMIVEKVAKSALAQSDPWQQLIAGCEAFLDVCLDPVIQRIVLIDGPSVLGWEKWREIDNQCGAALFREGLRQAMDAGLIERQPVESLARLLLGAINEGAMLIAHSDNVKAARAEVGGNIRRLLEGLRKSPAKIRKTSTR